MKLAHRWPAALGLGAAILQLVSGANRDLAAIVVGIATLCYLGAAALHRPWVAWAGVLGGSAIVFGSELIGLSWWVGLGITAVLLVAFGMLRGVPRKALVLQAVALVGFGGLAVSALLIAPRAGLVLVGLVLASHAIWDLLHFRRNQVVARSLSEACMAFDVPVGLGIVLLAVVS